MTSAFVPPLTPTSGMGQPFHIVQMPLGQMLRLVLLAKCIWFTCPWTNFDMYLLYNHRFKTTLSCTNHVMF